MEICYKVERLDEDYSTRELGTLQQDDTGTQAFGTRVISETSGLWCLDRVPLRPLAELSPGNYSIFAYLSKRSSGDPLSESVNATFTVAATAPPPTTQRPPPHVAGAIEGKFDLLNLLKARLAWKNAPLHGDKETYKHDKRDLRA